jgi:hypothetical protein
VEVRDINWPEVFALDCRADDPGLLAGITASSDLSEQQVVAIALALVSELVVMVLRGSGETRREHFRTCDRPLVRCKVRSIFLNAAICVQPRFLLSPA